MRYTMTFLESDFNRLITHLRRSENEEAAYVSARVVSMPDEMRFLVRSVTPVLTEEIEYQFPDKISIWSRSYVQAIKKAALDDSAFVFVHSHPGGTNEFSEQDNREELLLFNLAHD